MKHPRLLSAGNNNKVVALSATEVGKLFAGDTRSDIGSEAEKMQVANQINSLIVRFLRLDIDNETDSEMLVMERLYPFDFRAYEVAKREPWLEVFEDEVKGLHRKGFVHGDLERPSGTSGEKYDNIFLTETGLRLSDVGISVLREKVGDKLFERRVRQELEELEKFGQYFLNR